jgi:6-phosphogluconolactonase
MNRHSDNEPLQDSTIHLYPHPDILFEQCAAHLLSLVRNILQHQERCHIALAGGETPRALYRQLSRTPQESAPDWRRVEFYFGDERHVAPDHPDSNYRMAREELFTPLAIRDEAIHRIHTEQNPEEALAHYRQALTALPQRNALPRFDIVLLGMGADGHIASLFPGSALLEERQQTVSAGYIDKLGSWRFSLTLPVLNNAEHILLLVSGNKKADIIRHVMHGPGDAMPLPVELLERERLEWFIDRAAGRLLDIEDET